MPEAPRAPRSVPPWAASRMTMLELWRCAWAAVDVACDAAAACAAAGAGDATLVGCAEAGAAGACFACALKLVSASAAIAATVRTVRFAIGRVVRTRIFSSIEIAFGDLGDTSSRITNCVVNLRRAMRGPMRKRDGRCRPKTKTGTAVPCPHFADQSLLAQLLLGGRTVDCDLCGSWN